MISTPATTAAPGQEQTVLLTWTVHLLRRQPERLPKIVAVLGAVFAASLFVFHSFWLALLPTLAALFSVSEYVFPIHYTLSPSSAGMKCGLTALEIRWPDVRHAYLTDDSVKLSPLHAKNSRMEPLRGVTLRFDDKQREAIIDLVKRCRAEAQPLG